jgi:hypothetical protein
MNEKGLFFNTQPFIIVFPGKWNSVSMVHKIRTFPENWLLKNEILPSVAC